MKSYLITELILLPQRHHSKSTQAEKISYLFFDTKANFPQWETILLQRDENSPFNVERDSPLVILENITQKSMQEIGDCGRKL